MNDDTIQPVKSLMDSLEYSQIVQSPTFVSAGSTLDHVYVKPTFDIVQNSIVSVYYSDHDAVKISIKHKQSYIDSKTITYNNELTVSTTSPISTEKKRYLTKQAAIML